LYSVQNPLSVIKKVVSKPSAV